MQENNLSKINFKILMILDIIFIEIAAALCLVVDKKIMVVNLVIITILIILLAVFFKGFMSSMDSIISNAEKLYKGELNINDIIVYNNNEFKTLAKSLNTLKANLLFFIDNTKKTTIDLSSSFEICSKNIDISCAENEKIRNLMEDVSMGTQKELNVVNESLQLVNTISSSVDKMSAKITDIEKAVIDLNGTSKDVTKDLNAYSSSIDVISNDMNEANKFIKKFKEDLAEITAVVDFIRDISEQLKLLSLNASIESARCGEAGKGFSVIAGEITNLSEVTNEGINKINEFIKNMINNSSDVERSITSSINSFQKGNKVFESAKQVFVVFQNKNNQILNNMGQVADEMGNIDNIVKENTLLSEKIVNSTKQISEEAGNVYSITEDVLKNNDEINKASVELEKVTDRLKNSVGMFKIGISPANKMPDKKLKISMIIIDKNRGLWLAVKQGALYAKNELSNYNTHVKLIFMLATDTDEMQMEVLKECIAEKPDGICILGNRESYIPVIDEAYDNGIYTITYNNDFKGKSKRIACVQQDQYKSGFVAGEELAYELGRKGNVVIFNYKEVIDSMMQRISGLKDALKKYKNVKIIDEVLDNIEEDKAVEIFKDYLKKNSSKIDGIFFTARYKLRFGEVIKELNLQNKMKVAVYDSCPITLKNVKDGVFSCIINQDGFGQGHDPLVSMYNYLVGGKNMEENIPSRIELINSENVDNYIV